jgi:hypothetical protein
VFQRRAVDIRAKYGPAMMIALFRNRVVYARGGGGGCTPVVKLLAAHIYPGPGRPRAFLNFECQPYTSSTKDMRWRCFAVLCWWQLVTLHLKLARCRRYAASS